MERDSSKEGDGRIAKRVKRRVLARPHSFFAVTAPGLEGTCRDELAQLALSDPQLRIVEGGVAFRGSLPDLYLANLKLRTASRILMRIARFEARHFSSLERTISTLPWELYLPSTSDLSFRVASHRSQLYHQRAIMERFEHGIASRMERSGIRGDQMTGERPQQGVYVRVVADRFTVSVDSSGALLHKRGLKAEKAYAPLRATLAAAVLRWARYEGSEVLLDPMCGTGVFSLEAAMVACNIPAGWYRDFAFFRWPSFRPGQWNHLRRQCREDLRTIKGPCVFAADIDPEVCRMLGELTQAYGLKQAVSVRRADFLSLNPAEFTERRGLVVLNPPYGLRLATPPEAERLFGAFCERLHEKYKGWRLALMVPQGGWEGRVPLVGKWSLHPIFHGGLRLNLLVGKVG